MWWANATRASNIKSKHISERLKRHPESSRFQQSLHLVCLLNGDVTATDREQNQARRVCQTLVSQPLPGFPEEAAPFVTCNQPPPNFRHGKGRGFTPAEDAPEICVQAYLDGVGARFPMDITPPERTIQLLSLFRSSDLLDNLLSNDEPEAFQSTEQVEAPDVDEVD